MGYYACIMKNILFSIYTHIYDNLYLPFKIVLSASVETGELRNSQQKKNYFHHREERMAL